MIDARDDAALSPERSAIRLPGQTAAQTAAMSARFRLRAATSAIHERVELQMDIAQRLGSIEAYQSLLEDFFSLIRPIERSFAAFETDLPELDLAGRRKSGWLSADLIDLGHSAATIDMLPEFSAAPIPASRDEAFGALYVLEGSSLGGQVILRRIASALGVSPAWAGRYFNGYGTNTGAMWQVFVAALDKAGADPSAAQSIETSALRTFAAFEECLGAGRPRQAPKAEHETAKASANNDRP